MNISHSKERLIPQDKLKKISNLQKITIVKPIYKRPLSAGTIRTTGKVIDLIRKLNSKNNFQEYVVSHAEKLIKDTEDFKSKLNQRRNSMPRPECVTNPTKKPEEKKEILSQTTPLGKPPTGRKPLHETVAKEELKQEIGKIPSRPPLIQRNSAPTLRLTEKSDFPKFKNNIEDYTIGTQIGQGAYASVKLGVHMQSKLKCAFKTYEKIKLIDPHRKKNVQREIDIMRLLDQPNIVKLYEVLDTPKQLLIVMEYIQGCSLHGYLKRKPNRRLEENEAKKLIKQILIAVEYCHRKNIAHRDLKLENLLVDDKGNIKLIDFGFSTHMPKEQKTRIFCGTPSYMAPEIVSRKEYAGPPVDIWAIGVLLYVLLCGGYPFKGSNDTELYRKIQQGIYNVPQHVTIGAKSLILKILKLDPNRRPSCFDILQDPWLNSSGIFMNKPDEDIPSIMDKACSVNGDALDLDIVCSIKKLGYNESQLLQELQNENSHISKLYQKMKLSRNSSSESNWNKKTFMSAGMR